MASTFTSLGLEQLTAGEKSGTWGTNQNDKHVLIEELTTGKTAQAVTSADVVLTYANGATSIARHAVLEFTGAKTANRQVTVPAVEKTWIFVNNTTADFTLTVIAAGGSGIVLQQGAATIAYCDGTNVLTPESLQKRLWVPATAMSAATTNGAAAAAVELTAGNPELSVYDFDGTTAEAIYFTIDMPANWDLSTVTFNATWTSVATDTDGVAFRLSGVAFDDGGAIDTAYGTAITVTDAAQSTANLKYKTATSAAVTIAGAPTAGEIVYLKLERNPADAGDTMVEDARLLGVNINYTVLPGGVLS